MKIICFLIVIVFMIHSVHCYQGFRSIRNYNFCRSTVITTKNIVQNNNYHRLFGTMSEEDSVVARCTSKIQEMLKPVKLSVTSSNDDPNGSHVSTLINKFSIILFNQLLINY